MRHRVGQGWKVPEVRLEKEIRNEQAYIRKQVQKSEGKSRLSMTVNGKNRIIGDNGGRWEGEQKYAAH